jgi:hypothetical protein
MAKKVNAVFNAQLVKNQYKGGAWLAEFDVVYDYEEKPRVSDCNAFSNASAGKRWIKEMVLAHTNKKSIKWVGNDERDEKDKPVFFNGNVVFKVEASAL